MSALNIQVTSVYQKLGLSNGSNGKIINTVKELWWGQTSTYGTESFGFTFKLRKLCWFIEHQNQKKKNTEKIQETSQLDTHSSEYPHTP